MSCTDKYLLALKCLNSAQSLAKDHPRLHEQTIHFRHVINPVLASLHPKVQEVIKADFTAIEAAADLKKMNDEFRKQHAQSPDHVLSAIRTAKLLGNDQAKCEKELIDMLQLKEMTFTQASAVLDTLRRWGGGGAAAFEKAAHEKWPEVTLFA
jgi:hypothetical protein